MPPCACLDRTLVFAALRKHKVPPLRFAPVGMTEYLREGRAQAEREEFIEDGCVTSSGCLSPTSRAENAREMGHPQSPVMLVGIPSGWCAVAENSLPRAWENSLT